MREIPIVSLSINPHGINLDLTPQRAISDGPIVEHGCSDIFIVYTQ